MHARTYCGVEEGPSMTPRIKTTVVGSYPVLSWMVGNPSRLVLRDAMMAVLKTQELAGIDLVTDGELMRFDPSHPETNGMVDYFVSQMDGIRKHVLPADFDRFRADRAAGYRLSPPAIVVGKIGEGTLNLPRDYEFARSADAAAAQVHLHRPAHARAAADQLLLPGSAGSGDGHRRRAAAPARARRRRHGADGRGEHRRPSRRTRAWAAEAINHVLDGILNEKSRAHLLRQLRRPADAARASGAT